MAGDPCKQSLEMSSVASTPGRAQHLAESDRRPTAAALGGLRVVAGRLGQQWAEFEVVVSSGTVIHRAWRTHTDFDILFNLMGAARRCQNMPNTNGAWNMLQQQRRWFNTTEIDYPVDKHRILEVFLESLLFEVGSPTQLLNFADELTWNADSPDLAGGARSRRGCACEAIEDPESRDAAGPRTED